jgi:hypothetical protein
MARKKRGTGIPHTRIAVDRTPRQNRRVKKAIHRAIGGKKPLGAHPLHSSKVHAPTGAHLIPHPRKAHNAFTHARPFKVPKGMHSRKKI